MKINARILLIILTVVALISFTSTIIYNSLANSFLQTQHSKTLLNSTNLFIFSFQLQTEKADDDFQKTISGNPNPAEVDITGKNYDFIFTLIDNNRIDYKSFVSKDYVINTGETLNKFINDNKNVILTYKTVQDITYYYGFLITDKLLTDISEKIQAEVALFVDGTLIHLSNVQSTRQYIINIENAYTELKFKNNFDLTGVELGNADFLSSIYTPNNILTPSGRISFIIFSESKEAVEFRDTMQLISIIIIPVSIALSIILVLIFTAKLRKQISLLSETAEITSKGNLHHRAQIILKDEIGKFGEAFNAMLDKLMAKEKAEKDYVEFIALLNQNPTMIEVSDQALAKIINSTGLTLGLLYLVENEQLRMVSSYGISDNVIKPSGEIDFYKNVIKKKEIAEFDFENNNPVVRTGIAEIKIKYLLVAPVVYNKKVIAILELASEKKPEEDVKVYIEKIQEQLAVGLTNAKTLEQLENIVEELRKLNEEYQKQNSQITEQNKQLIELHEKLKQNAGELEKQRARAVELTKVKSGFLASMSHELRTPLNSILGLTELVIKDSLLNGKTKERLSVVLRNGNKLLTLINNILEFSKIETGKIEFKIEKFSLRDFASEIFAFIEPFILEKHLNFSLIYNFKYDKLMETDKGKIEQVLINLLGNAVKFTDSGEVRLEFYAMDNHLEMKVIDTGIGIEDKNIEEIFSEFKQLDSSTSRNYGGTGLGLAICKKYVSSLSGEINVKSETGKGSEFCVKLPGIIKEELKDIEVEEVKYFAVEQETEEEPYVMIVNNSRQIQKLIADYLHTNNYKSKSFVNGREALNFIDKEIPSAIILDVNIHDVTPWDFILQVNEIIKKNICMLVTTIDENRKVGYGFSVKKYIRELKEIDLDNDKVFPVSCRKVLFFSDVRNISQNKTGRTVDFIDDFSEAYNLSRFEEYDLIVINITRDNFEGVDLYFELKKNKLTRQIPIMFELGKELTQEISRGLIKRINELVLRENHHPMDVLKVIRDTLQISTDPQNIIDTSHEAEISELLYFNKQSNEHTAKRKGKVLIVDDDNDTLFTVDEIVKDLGFETFYARNGVECLLSLNSVMPDIILLDIMMPQMDGFETIRRIRSNEKYKHLTVIALTAYAMLDNKEVIEKNGFNDLITKPVKSSEIKTKLKNYMNKLLRK